MSGVSALSSKTRSSWTPAGCTRLSATRKCPTNAQVAAGALDCTVRLPSGVARGGGGGPARSAVLPEIFRLFNDLRGSPASWLLPAALIVLGAGRAWRPPGPEDRSAQGRAPAVGNVG